MNDFLDEVNLILEWVDGTGDIDNFEKEFSNLVHKYRMEDGVKEIAEVIAHNYVCHKHNRKEAIVSSLDQWNKLNKKD